MSFFVRVTDWQDVREHFTEPEKTILRNAICGEAICPAGTFIDEQKAGAVGGKLKDLLAKRAAAAGGIR